jgi:AraC-like DNA-binding protein
MTAFHWSLDAVGAAESEERLTAISPHLRLGRGADPRHTVEVHGEERFSILRMEAFGPMSGWNEPDDTITMVYPFAGGMRWQVGDERGASTDPWLQGVTSATTVHFGPMTELAVFLRKDPLTRFGRAFYGDDDFELAFDSARPRSPGLAAHLGAALHYAHATVSSPAFGSPIVQAALHRHLAISLFESFRLRGDHGARAVSARARQHGYRVATRFIDDFASLPITPEDIAQAAGLSTAQIDAVFRAFSPRGEDTADHLRRARLSSAHAEIRLAGVVDEGVVGEVAARWGFPSAATFTRLYRRAYGALPGSA